MAAYTFTINEKDFRKYRHQLHNAIGIIGGNDGTVNALRDLVHIFDNVNVVNKLTENEIKKPINNISELICFCDKINDVIMMHDQPRVASMSLNIGYDDEEGPFSVWLYSENTEEISVCFEHPFPINGDDITDKVIKELTKIKDDVIVMIGQIKKIDCIS